MAKLFTLHVVIIQTHTKKTIQNVFTRKITLTYTQADITSSYYNRNATSRHATCNTHSDLHLGG